MIIYYEPTTDMYVDSYDRTTCTFCKRKVLGYSRHLFTKMWRISDFYGRYSPLYVITIENGTVTGGLGTAVVEYMMDNGFTPHIKRLGLPDRFIEHGSTPQLLHICNIDENAVISALQELTSEPKQTEV